MHLQPPILTALPLLRRSIVVLVFVRRGLSIPYAQHPMLVAKEDQVLRRLRVIRSAVYAVDCDLGPGDNFEIPHPVA
jgi:hypothetical protein